MVLQSKGRASIKLLLLLLILINIVQEVSTDCNFTGRPGRVMGPPLPSRHPINDSAYRLVWRPWWRGVGNRETKDGGRRRDVEVGQLEWMQSGEKFGKQGSILGSQGSFCY